MQLEESKQREENQKKLNETINLTLTEMNSSKPKVFSNIHQSFENNFVNEMKARDEVKMLEAEVGGVGSKASIE